MRYSLIIVILTGCLSSESQRHSLLLPSLDASQLLCCWQSQELLVIDWRGYHLELSSVLATAEGSLISVIFDPLGQRVVTINQNGTDVSIDAASQLPDGLPINWLLLGIYLRYVPIASWRFTGSDWQAHETGNLRTLSVGGEAVIESLTERVSKGADNNEVSELYFSILDMKVQVTVLSRIPL